MSTGNKVAVAAMGLLIVAVVGYYGLRDDPQQAGGSNEVKLPDDANLPQPDASDIVDGHDPAITVVAVDDGAVDDEPTDFIKPLDLPQLSGLDDDGPTDEPVVDDTPEPVVDDEPTPDPLDDEPVGLPIIDDSADATDEPTDVTPVPVNVLEQTTDVAPIDDPDDTVAVGRGDDGGDDEPTAGSAKYIVVENDSLWIIARKTLGAGHKWERIRDANPGIDPDRLKIGMELVIPAVGPAPAPDPQTADEPTAEDPLGLGLNRDMRQVQVMENDSLWTIAQREYNDGTKWTILWDANKHRLKDKNSLRVGQKILVPPLPADE